MRISRKSQLWPLKSNVHLYWRCHNREFYLNEGKIRELYFSCLKRGLEFKNQKDTCEIHAYCAMNNHFHISATYKEGSINLSNFMRYTQGIFGARYNKMKKRCGRVTQDRPKTPLVQNEKHAMRVHFYIEANPIRARQYSISNLHLNTDCSYGFYAHGIQSKHTDLLTIPDWYIRLGSNPIERQKKYRELFAEYLNDFESPTLTFFKQRFIGDDNWIFHSNLIVNEPLERHREDLIAATEYFYPRDGD